MTAAVIPDERAVLDPGGACVADERQDLDNAAFADRVIAVAAAFAGAGLRRGDVLALVLPNRLELVTSMFAAWRLGAAVTPVNPALTAQEAGYQIADAGARLVVADNGAAVMLRDSPCRIFGLDEVTAPPRPAPPPPLVSDPAALALLIYTSGTTGRPKGVMLDHANVRATAELVTGWFEMTADTRSLLVLPLFHVNGIMVSVVSPLLAGGSAFVAERFQAASFWTTVEKVRPTFFSAVPTIYALLASRPGPPPDTSSLRYVVCGAAPMPRQLISEFEDRFGVPVVEGYGLSECTVCCTANPVRGVRKAGSVGLPLPGVDVGVADDAGALLPAGQAGEVVVRGPNVMRGYLGRPQESAQVLRGGWLHTGDVGRFDEDGYLTLIDRVKDLIIRGGENIYPKEIEDVLYAHPAVLEAAVVGQPDPVFGEQPVAFVTLRPGQDAEPEDLVEHCRLSLARYKVPRAVFIETALPKNALGKIAKPVLRQRFLHRRGPGQPLGLVQDVHRDFRQRGCVLPIVVRAEEQFPAAGQQDPDISLGAAPVAPVPGVEEPPPGRHRPCPAVLRPAISPGKESCAHRGHLLRSGLQSTRWPRDRPGDKTCRGIAGRYGRDK
jgi:acyl-CoA synthetase (AMP-forming)/AMP-acid ligase II